MSIVCDLQVFGCLTHGHTSSVSVSWHFFAGRGIDAALTATVLGRMRTTAGPLSDGFAGPVRPVGAEQPQMTPEQAAHADGRLCAEFGDDDDQAASAGSTQLLLDHVGHDHLVAVNDLGTPLASVAGRITVEAGGVDVEVRQARLVYQAAVGAKIGRTRAQRIGAGPQHPSV